MAAVLANLLSVVLWDRSDEQGEILLMRYVLQLAEIVPHFENKSSA